MSTALTTFEQATQAAATARAALEAREAELVAELKEIRLRLGRKKRTAKVKGTPKAKTAIEAREQA